MSECVCTFDKKKEIVCPFNKHIATLDLEHKLLFCSNCLEREQLSFAQECRIQDIENQEIAATFYKNMNEMAKKTGQIPEIPDALDVIEPTEEQKERIKAKASDPNKYS